MNLLNQKPCDLKCCNNLYHHFPISFLFSLIFFGFCIVGGRVLALQHDNMFHPGEVVSTSSGLVMVAFPDSNSTKTQTYGPELAAAAVIPDRNPLVLDVRSHVVIKHDNSGPFELGFVISKIAVDDGSTITYTDFEVQKDSNTNDTYNLNQLRYHPNHLLYADHGKSH